MAVHVAVFKATFFYFCLLLAAYTSLAEESLASSVHSTSSLKDPGHPPPDHFSSSPSNSKTVETNLLSPRNRRDLDPNQIRQFYNNNKVSNRALQSAFRYNDEILRSLLQSQTSYNKNPYNSARSEFFYNILRPLDRRTTRYNSWDDHSVMHFGKRSVPTDDLRTIQLNEIESIPSDGQAHVEDREEKQTVEERSIPSDESRSIHSNARESELLDNSKSMSTDGQIKQEKVVENGGVVKRSPSLSDHGVLHFGKREYDENKIENKDDIPNHQNSSPSVEESRKEEDRLADQLYLSDIDKRDNDPWHSMMSFGKRDGNDPWHNVMSFGKRDSNDPWHSVMSFGKRDSNDPWHSVMSFGKRDSNDPWHSVMRFGKRDGNDPWHNVMSFGKRDSNDPWHSVMSFGKRDGNDPWHNVMSFGKRDSNDPWHSVMSFGKRDSNDPWHSVMSFGKRDGNDPWHNVMSFGKRDGNDPWHSVMSFGKRDGNDPWHNVMSFGKRDSNDPWHSVMSFGKRDGNDPWHSVMSFGKRDSNDPWHSVMSFGKRDEKISKGISNNNKENVDFLDKGLKQKRSIRETSGPVENELVPEKRFDVFKDHNTMHFGKKSDPWDSHNTLHFGKKSDPWDTHNTLHFGKKSDPWDSHNTLHFGKKSDEWNSHNTMHFGKKSDPWESHTMHFGKKSDPWDSHNTMHFGKRSDVVHDSLTKVQERNILKDKTEQPMSSNTAVIDNLKLNKRSATYTKDGDSINDKKLNNQEKIEKYEIRVKRSVILKNVDAIHKNTELKNTMLDNQKDAASKKENQTSIKSSENKKGLKQDPKSIEGKSTVSNIGKRSVVVAENKVSNHITSPQINEEKSIEEPNTDRDKVLHFGKRSIALDEFENSRASDNQWNNEEDQLTKRSENAWDLHNTMHFGKKSDPWDLHNTMHFGKKSDPVGVT
ncbi:hypothetical protein JTE90_021963 [Oedothorax gibbosus]|uniref:Uncharacterized protein n=1 Tax=Oedothorax gibbosus TaxID=931172 RepID=A0AAV6V5L3_9ARAC|nr:hypothetical protein JTE90_021963 [Oedothorax gibbosus]